VEALQIQAELGALAVQSGRGVQGVHEGAVDLLVAEQGPSSFVGQQQPHGVASGRQLEPASQAPDSFVEISALTMQQPASWASGDVLLSRSKCGMSTD